MALMRPTKDLTRPYMYLICLPLGPRVLIRCQGSLVDYVEMAKLLIRGRFGAMEEGVYSAFNGSLSP